MKLIQAGETQEVKNNRNCTVTEYPFGDPDVDIALATINGRDPEMGHVVNTECKEIGCVIKGTGSITIEGQEYPLETGDAVLILPGERFSWDGHLTLSLSCSPAWTPEQYRMVD